jgi:hypothetical protein
MQGNDDKPCEILAIASNEEYGTDYMRRGAVVMLVLVLLFLLIILVTPCGRR